MQDLAVATCHRSDIIGNLERCYPRLEEHGALQAVVDAVRALTTVGLDDDEDADRLVATVAERRVRQRLGLDAMDARSDQGLEPAAHLSWPSKPQTTRRRWAG